MYTKKITGKNPDINERHYTEHLHKTNTTTLERIHYHNRFATFYFFFTFILASFCLHFTSILAPFFDPKKLQIPEGSEVLKFFSIYQISTFFGRFL